MLIFGHRGAVSPTCFENTLAAVDRALLLGADGVEIDVRLTADEQVVVHHDPTFRRTAKDPRLLAALSTRELPQVHGHPVPLLDEVLGTVERRGRVVVELKTLAWPPSARGALVTAVIAVLARHPRTDVVVSSFDRPAVSLMRRRLAVPTALLGRPRLPLAALLRWAEIDGHAQAHAHVSSLLARTDLLETRPIEVVGWTVNQPADQVRLAGCGVSAVICDDPVAARAALVSRPLARAV